MARTSTVPAALTALASMLKTALPGVTVSDGPVVNATGAAEVVIVGWTGDDGATESVEGADELGDLGGSQTREQYTIHNAIVVSRGTAKIADARDRAFELLAAVDDALTADRRLGRTVMLAQLSTVNLRQEQNQRGAVASVLFDVDVDAFSSP